jgi:outer membrane biogenesis lipoprotein LolB
MDTMKAFKHAIAAAAALLLAACGGSSSDQPAETQQQREDRVAASSIDGLMSFTRGLVGAPAEAEPRPVGGISPPASETAEPQPL